MSTLWRAVALEIRGKTSSELWASASGWVGEGPCSGKGCARWHSSDVDQ